MHEVIRAEIQGENRRPTIFTQRLSILCVSVVEAFAQCVAGSAELDRISVKPLVEAVVDDLLAQQVEAEASGETSSANITARSVLHAFFGKFIGLCFEEDWPRKLAGCLGLDVLLTRPSLKARWVPERQLDYARALFFVLRDSPKEAPQALPSLVEMLKSMIVLCCQANADDVKLTKLIDILVLELPSPKTVVREAAKSCIAILAEIKEKSQHDLIASAAKARLLDPTAGPIFNKPLRALPFGMQIGNIDAITYLLNLTPSLPEHNDELLRMLHETIALADADDASLIGRVTHHALEVSLRNLRVACLKLLCAAMACTDMFAKQHPIRSK